MKAKVYIETTVVSYYTAWPSRDVVIAGHQQVTRDWWMHPGEYINDAIHISIAATNGIDYLVTWNCKHLANALTRGRLQQSKEQGGAACGRGFQCV